MTQLTTNALPLAPGVWALDRNHSSVGFSIRHLGVSKVRGTFRSFTTDVVVGHDLATTSVAATIDVASLDTGNADRDAHVLSADILDVQRRPTLTFRSERIVAVGDGYRVEGQASLGGTTRPLSLAVEFGGAERFADGTLHAGFEATGELHRKDFGIDVKLPPGVSAAMLGDVVKIQLDVQLLEPPAGEAA